MGNIPAMQRIAVTGSSGYLGRRFVEHLRARCGDVQILGMDIQRRADASLDELVELDIRSDRVTDVLSQFRPDTIIHAAFAFQPMRNEAAMHEINVQGSRNLLQAAAAVRPRRLMVVSSATAYGAWLDNPLPITESHRLRARTEFRYAADKTEVEQIVGDFAGDHPEIAVSLPRPAIIGGPRMDNYLSRFLFGMPFLVLIDGYDTPVQFVHEHDIVAAMCEILTADARGAFNVGPPNWTTMTEIARETGRRVLSLPFWLVRFVHATAWAARLPFHESPSGLLCFARYPWVVAPSRLERELGFRFEFSSRDTLRDIIQNRSHCEH